MRTLTRIVVLLGLTLILLPAKLAIVRAQSMSLLEAGGNYNYLRTLGSGAGLTLTSYQAGPRYRFPQVRRFVPFAQVLLGGSHASGSYASDTGLSNAFAATMGGGIDVELTSRVAVRAFEADYAFLHFPNGVNDHQNNLRISVGIAFKLGKR